jgi:hypothetical protein
MSVLPSNQAISNQAIQTALEVLVDMIGVRSTLDLLAEVCHDKAEHIRANWQDKHTTAAWTQAAARVKQCSVMEAVKFVSNDMYDAMAGVREEPCHLCGVVHTHKEGK